LFPLSALFNTFCFLPFFIISFKFIKSLRSAHLCPLSPFYLFISFFLPDAHYRRSLPCQYAADIPTSAASTLYKTSAFTL
jgi:hypothetical protein